MGSSWKHPVPAFKNFGCGHNGDLCPNLPLFSIPPPKIDIDNKARFRYLDGYWTV
jgi:hypothetical protein